jgi:HD superfamily phosphohydrolase
VRDPIHGEIEILGEETLLMDSPEMQRLRNLHQLPAVQYVYPGATHTRFAHSLGVLELATRIAQRVGVTRESREMRGLRAAALLDDIDEAPFNPLFKESYPTDYGSLSLDIRKTLATRVCEGANANINHLGRSIDIDFVLGILLKNSDSSFYSQIIGSEVGADRLDFLLRDAYYSGAAYGAGLDLSIIGNMRRIQGKLVIESSAVPQVDHLFSVLFQMKRHVYDHKIARAVTVTLDYSIRKLLAKGHPLKAFLVASSSPLRLHDDASFLTRLGKLDPTTLQRFWERNFPHCIYETDAQLLKPEVANTLDLLRDKRSEAEKELSGNVGSTIMLDFASSTWKIVPATAMESYEEGIGAVSLSKSEQLARWYSKSVSEPFREWRMYVFCDNPDLKVRTRAAQRCDELFRYLRVGSAQPVTKPIGLLKQAYKVAEGRLPPEEIRSYRRTILALPPHIRKTLEKVVELNKPLTADEVSQLTKRSRPVESLYLNHLERQKLLRKTIARRREVRFGLADPRLVTIMRELFE